MGFVLHALRRWWHVAMPAGLFLAIICGTAVWAFVKPKYEAAAWLEIKEQRPYLAFPSMEDRTQAFFQTQSELIRSPMVMSKVVARPEIKGLADIQTQGDAVEWLRSQIKVVYVGSSELFRIVMVSTRPEDAKTIVNTVTEEYFRLRDDNETSLNQKVLDLLEKEQERRSSEVRRLRSEVRDKAREATGKDLLQAKSESDEPGRQRLGDLRGRLVSAELDRVMLEARIQASEEYVTSPPAGESLRIEGPQTKRAGVALSERDAAFAAVMTDKLVSEKPEMLRLSTIISEKESRLSDAETKLRGGKRSPMYVTQEKELELDRQALEKLRIKLRQDVEREVEAAILAKQAETLSTQANREREELVHMKQELKGRQIAEQRLKEVYDKELERAKQGSGDTLDLEFKRDELARAERVYEMIAQRTLQLSTERGAPARVNLLQLAAVPSSPMEKYPFKNALLAGLAALCLPFGLAVLWERLIRRVCEPQDFQHHASLVVGEVPRLPSCRVRPRSAEKVRISRALQVFEESIDSLRTTLMLSENLKDLRCLAVTSAINHEGKTSVSSQLAMSLARATAQDVLVVDGDLRSPDIHSVFGVPLEPGLAEVLAGTCPLEQAIVRNWDQHLHLLPAGKLKGNPHGLFGNGVWPSVLQRLRRAFRYVIVDTPPVLAASEALMLATGADASLVCAMRDVSRVDQVSKTYERLLVAGANPVGIVLNGLPSRAYIYRYGSYDYLES